MDLIVILGLIFWIVSKLAGMGKKQNARGAARNGAPPPEAEAPMRPIDVDLPGQTTMPLYAERPMPTPETPMASRLTSMELTTHGTYDEPAEQQRSAYDKPEATTVYIPGLDLEIDGKTLVKGVIFSEILNRRSSRRPT